ncbi:cupin domain-containing protein [Candidatus Aerophobetes bacterium]|uniref:Cupin domain-containing protein n=1 Tax=Aerophobetes bacterium TaxID=2030807 RepID=A0A523RNP3_UNCAE|nr:MAG: cupin domain-containing protein [Candidatus Aerophobetes bacterium]
MRKILLVNEVDYERVEWGLTKTLVGPQNVGSKKLKVNITEYLPGHVHKLHSHPNQEEVIYVLSGKGITETEEGKRKIEPDSVVFIPEGVKHATWNLSRSESLKAIIIMAPSEVSLSNTL